MAWTYSGDPASSPKDAVRFGIGDTDINHQLVSDEEIAYALAQNNDSVPAAILELAIALRNKFAAYVDEKTDRLSKKYSDLYDHYKSMVDQIIKDSALSAVPYAGGISKGDKLNNVNDTDNVRPKFDKNLDEHDNNARSNFD